jgi:DMSO/TMAO reductase YedYZ molybdopterin-dependent catalytic subunit
MENDDRYQKDATRSEPTLSKGSKEDLNEAAAPVVDTEAEEVATRVSPEVVDNLGSVEAVGGGGEDHGGAGKEEAKREDREAQEFEAADNGAEDVSRDGIDDAKAEVAPWSGERGGAGPAVLIRSRATRNGLVLRGWEGRIRELPIGEHRFKTRRDLLLFGIGSIAAIRGLTWALPASTQVRLGIKGAQDSATKEAILNRALHFDDNVAESLQSAGRNVKTYGKHEITELKNNYAGMTPDPSYIPDWKLTLSGLASGSEEVLSMRSLRMRFPLHEQITRLVCVEGWSAVAWWDGFPFSELLRAFPPSSQARFAKVESGVNLDAAGNPDPYYVSLDLGTARHPQTLLATHFKGAELGPEHGAPLRLVAPMKLGLKNVKAITRITYTGDEPTDYWAERGYSRFDGL